MQKNTMEELPQKEKLIEFAALFLCGLMLFGFFIKVIFL